MLDGGMASNIPKVLLLVVSLLSFGCEDAALPPLQECALTGDATVIADFAGRWYDTPASPMVVVEEGDPSRLRAFLPAYLHLKSARTVGAEIHFILEEQLPPENGFDVQGAETSQGVLSLRLLKDNLLLMVPPGGKASGCGTCTPHLARLSRVGQLKELAARIPRQAAELAEETYEEMMYWLAGVL